jgi:hypothetical protein
VKPISYIQVSTTTTSYTAKKKDELSFTANDKIYVIMVYGNGWCVGLLNGKYGLVQQKFLKKVGEGSGGKFYLVYYFILSTGSFWCIMLCLIVKLSSC